jgi:hypothetical protein
VSTGELEIVLSISLVSGGWGVELIFWERFRFGGALNVFNGVNSYPCVPLLGGSTS